MSARARPAGMEPSAWTNLTATSAAAQRVRAGQLQAGRDLEAGLLGVRANNSLGKGFGAGLHQIRANDSQGAEPKASSGILSADN